MKKPAPREHDLQMTIITYLRLRLAKQGYVFAIPNAGKRSRGTASYMLAEGLSAGVADICVMLRRGRVIWLEVKTGSGRQSPKQKNFEAICKALGHEYYIVRSLDDATALLWHALAELNDAC